MRIGPNAAARVVVSIAIAFGGPIVAAAQNVELVPARCERACLEDLIERYLAAVIAHDPQRLPLSAEVRYTERLSRSKAAGSAASR